MSKRCLVIGGAHSVWRDVARVEAAVGGPWDGLVLAVNDILADLPRLDHVATLHPRTEKGKLAAWEERRRENGYPMAYTAWSHAKEGADAQQTGWSDGSSGLLAVGVALDGLGCEEVVLCGVRMDQQRNHFRDEKGWQQFNRYRRGWKRKVERMQGRVYSVSGWTADLLGRPEWLKAA